MTDFAPESAWTHPGTPSAPDFWESTRSSPLHEEAPRPARRSGPRPAAALAADLHELLESLARKRVPRLDAVRRRLLASRERLELGRLAESLQRLQAASAELDFLAGRSGGERTAEFLAQGASFTTEAARVAGLVAELRDQQALAAPVARLLWIELVLESASLRKRVRQGARWLAQMAQDLQSRLRQANTALAVRAIEELARRRQTMDQRLRSVHRLCGDARQVHMLCEQLAAERTVLAGVLQARVLAACRGLEQELQLLLHAAAYRALVPEELVAAVDARHRLQVELMQAHARLARMRSADAELGERLVAMEEKARGLA